MENTVLDRWISRNANLGVPFKVIYIRQYFTYKWHYANELMSSSVCLYSKYDD
jgi:hypothetical protein